jgi:hypothetical protein
MLPKRRWLVKQSSGQIFLLAPVFKRPWVSFLHARQRMRFTHTHTHTTTYHTHTHTPHAHTTHTPHARTHTHAHTPHAHTPHAHTHTPRTHTHTHTHTCSGNRRNIFSVDLLKKTFFSTLSSYNLMEPMKMISELLTAGTACFWICCVLLCSFFSAAN